MHAIPVGKKNSTSIKLYDKEWDNGSRRLPIEVFDGICPSVLTKRSQSSQDLVTPFYDSNRPHECLARLTPRRISRKVSPNSTCKY